MELLPIIYWSLVGFGILTLLVILISFLTYNIRKKLEKIPSENNKNKHTQKEVDPNKLYNNSTVTKQHHPKVIKRVSEDIFPNHSQNSYKNRKKRITILNDFFDDENTNRNS
ncbi:MAG: hypothetical protein ABFS12_10810 [Bacteroidota bacterium]